jgi:hypothetical protein
VEPRWFRIFIYITGVCRLVNLRRLALSLREAASVAARYASWRRFFPGFIRCACFVDCFFRRAFGARCDASFNHLVPGY